MAHCDHRAVWRVRGDGVGWLDVSEPSEACAGVWTLSPPNACHADFS